MEAEKSTHHEEVSPAGAAEATAASILDRVAMSEVIDVALPSGRSIQSMARPDGDLLTCRSRSGEVVLSVLVTDRGALLRMSAVDLDLSAAGRIGIACQDFEVIARRDAVVAAGRYADVKGAMVLLNSARPACELDEAQVREGEGR